MNAKKFSDAMSELDTKYVDEALNYKKKSQKSIWRKWRAMAACLCLIVVAIIAVPFILSPPESDNDVAGGDQNIGEEVLQFPDNVKTVEVIYSIYGADTLRELNQDEITTIKEWATALELQHETFDEGEAPNEVYVGGESWQFNVNDGELKFTYLLIDNHYIFVNDEWYLVKNPSTPANKDNGGDNMGTILNFLLNYITLAVAGIVFIMLLVVLFAKRKSLSKNTKLLLAVLLIILAAYFVFIVWITVAAGGNQPANPPTPIIP